jgi:hypothetical protein
MNKIKMNNKLTNKLQMREEEEEERRRGFKRRREDV